MTEHITPVDPYILHLMSLANMTNRLYRQVEKIVNVEGGKNFLDNLTELEAWLDEIATRQEKRLEFVMVFGTTTKEGEA